MIMAIFKPAIECNDTQRPTECKAGDGHGKVEEHHHICYARLYSNRTWRALDDLPSRPLLIAASVTSSVLNMNMRPPHAKKKLPRASVGGREGKTELGGPNHKKKYVKHLSTENPSRSHPQS